MNETVAALMQERFGKDSLIALATQEDGVPFVRAVNALYADGAFYIITHLKSRKMEQIRKSSAVGICGEWFTGHGKGESLGWLDAEENEALAKALRDAFSAWIGNGHVDEEDRDTIILKVTLTDGILMSQGMRYEF